MGSRPQSADHILAEISSQKVAPPPFMMKSWGCHEIISSITGNRSLTVAAPNAFQATDAFRAAAVRERLFDMVRAATLRKRAPVVAGP